MKRDPDVLGMFRERAKGRTQAQAATRAGMSVRTARKYEHLGQLPSRLKQPRRYRTRPNPFEADWPWIVAQPERDPALQASTVFAVRRVLSPGRYQATQLRTLQRRIPGWWAQAGPEREVLFPQVHEPGVDAQSGFTHMPALRVTLGGVPFPHLLFHLMFVYSNIEAVRVCFSESSEGLVEGIKTCLWQLGGVPQRQRTNYPSAASLRSMPRAAPRQRSAPAR